MRGLGASSVLIGSQLAKIDLDPIAACVSIFRAAAKRLGGANALSPLRHQGGASRILEWEVLLRPVPASRGGIDF